MTYYESKSDESNLLQGLREVLPSGHVIVRCFCYNQHKFHCAVGDGKGDNDATKTAVQQVERVIRDVQQTNERVITAGHDHQWDHVDDCKSTRTITQVFELGDYGTIPLDTVGAEDDVHSEDSRE